MSKLDLQWWTYDDPVDSAWSAYSSIYEGDSIRRDAYLRYLRLYSNTDDSYVGSTPADVWANERATMNIDKSIIDTVASKIAKSKPKAAFLTNAGNYTLKRKARLLEGLARGLHGGGLLLVGADRLHGLQHGLQAAAIDGFVHGALLACWAAACLGRFFGVKSK